MNPEPLRKNYDEAFKRDTVQLLETGRPLKQLATELGVDPATLRNWRNRYGKDAAVRGQPQTLETAQLEVRRLRQEVAELRRQREILKKTLGILAEPPGNGANGSTP
jgi:transposase